MDARFQAILDTLPPPRARSKLAPYAPLIRALRACGRSYRDIVAILRERCGQQVGTHTVYHFVRVRTRAHRTRTSQSPHRGRPATPRLPAPAAIVATPTDLDAHLAALTRRPPVAAPAPTTKEFAFNAHEPLRLIPPSKKT